MVILGIVLLVVGTALLVAEAHLPTYGAVGAAGVVSLVAGAALAVDAAGGSVALAVAAAAAIGLATAALLVIIVRASLAVSRGRIRTGAEALVGRPGVVRCTLAPVGQVMVEGALWRARSTPLDLDDEEELRVGDAVVVERVQGLTLSVRRAEEWELES